MLTAWLRLLARPRKAPGAEQDFAEANVGSVASPPSDDSTVVSLTDREIQRCSEPPLIAPITVSGPILKPGDRIAERIVVTRGLGLGGMATAYLAHHEGWGIDVALKVPHEELIRDQEHRDLIVHEAEAWTDLGLHPNIVYCYCVLPIGGIPVIVTEHMNGGSLREWLTKERTLQDKLNVAIQLSVGLGHAHSVGLAHRDLNPDNVLMTTDGWAKLTDFGLSTIAKERRNGPSILEFGRPEYTPPEGYSGLPMNPQLADIYALGVTLCEIFEHYHLHSVPANARSHGSVVQTHEPNLRALPKALHELLESCVAPNPGNRPQAASTILRTLSDLYQDTYGEQSAFSAPLVVHPEADGLNNRGVTYILLKRPADAMSAFEAALAAYPNHLQATFNRTLLEWQLGDLDEVTGPSAPLEMLRGATSVDQVELSIAIAQLYQHSQDPDGARAELESIPSMYETVFKEARPPAVRLRRTIDVSRDMHMLGSDGLTALSLGGESIMWSSKGNTFSVRRLDGTETKTFHTASDIAGVAMSSTGDRAVASLSNGSLEVWNLNTHKLVGTLRATSPVIDRGEITPVPVSAVAISLNGKTCAWSTKTGHVYVADLQAMSVTRVIGLRQQLPLFAAENIAWSLAITANGDKLITVGGRSLRLWDSQSGRCLFSVSDPEVLSDVAISPDGSKAYTGSWSGSVKVWSLERGEIDARLHSHSSLSISVEPRGRWALTGGDGVILWDLISGQRIRNLVPQEDASPWDRHHYTLIDSGHRVAIAAHGRSIDVWDIDLSNRYVQEFRLSRPAQISELMSGETLRDLALRRVREMWASGERQSAHDLFFSEWRKIGFRNEHVFAAFYDSICTKLPINSIQLMVPKTVFENTDEWFAFNDAGTHVLTWFRSEAHGPVWKEGESARKPPKVFVNLWDVNDSTHCTSWDASEILSHASVAAYTPDATTAIVVDSQSRLRVWYRSGKSCVLQESPMLPKFVGLTPDGHFGVAGGEWQQRGITVWDLRQCRVICCLDQPALGGAISPDGRTLVTWSGDTAVLQAIPDGRCVRRIKVGGKIESAAIAKDASHVFLSYSHLTKNRLGGLELWDVRSSTRIWALSLDARPGRVALAPDGRWAASVVREQRIGGKDVCVLWNLIWDRQIDHLGI